jgi:hypothetical protein
MLAPLAPLPEQVQGLQRARLEMPRQGQPGPLRQMLGARRRQKLLRP